jgi:hypothetical protein
VVAYSEQRAHQEPGQSQACRRSHGLGLGYIAVLVWVGSAFVGSFGDFDDAYPYWPAIPRLRTDTAGFIAFAVAIVCLVPAVTCRPSRPGRARPR